MQAIKQVGLLMLIACAATHADSYGEKEIQDPFSDEMVAIRFIYSFGSYIYERDSRFDLVFWPLTEEFWIALSQKSGYGAFPDDWDIAPGDQPALKEWLAANYDPAHPPQTHLDKLKWLEQVYSQRKKYSDFWCRFYRLMAYMTRADKDASLVYVKKAVAIAETEYMAWFVRTQGIPRDGNELDFDEEFCPFWDYMFTLGEYNRRLGKDAEAKDYLSRLKIQAYIDREGHIRIGNPYFIKLVAEIMPQFPEMPVTLASGVITPQTGQSETAGDPELPAGLKSANESARRRTELMAILSAPVIDRQALSRALTDVAHLWVVYRSDEQFIDEPAKTYHSRHRDVIVTGPDNLAYRARSLYLNRTAGGAVPQDWITALCAPPTPVLQHVESGLALAPGLIQRRDALIAQVHQTMKEGLIALAEKFPRLKDKAEGLRTVIEKDVFAAEYGRINIVLGMDLAERPPPSDAPGWWFWFIIRPTVWGEDSQVRYFSFFDNLDLEDVISAGAGDPALNAELENLLNTALAPLVALNAEAGKGRP
ncbi:MAG: hypothetical protein ABIF71_14575 [Planctomycetota bacterium]